MAGPAETDEIREGAPPSRPTPRRILEDWIAFGLFVVLAGVVFSQFFSRYVINRSIAWTEEAARFLLVAVVFVAAVGALRRGGHIAIHYLVQKLPPAGSRWIRRAVDAGVVAFCAYGSWLAIDVAMRAWRQTMSTLPVSRGWLYLIVAAALALMALRGIQRLWSGEMPSDEPETRL